MYSHTPCTPLKGVGGYNNSQFTVSADALTRSFFLHCNHRCKDKWFQGFLEQARDGALEWDMYNFIRGYSTFCPGSWLPPQRHMATMYGKSFKSRRKTLNYIYYGGILRVKCIKTMYFIKFSSFCLGNGITFRDSGGKMSERVWPQYMENRSKAEGKHQIIYTTMGFFR